MINAIFLLLCITLTIGVTGAWYKAKREAIGTLIINQGIILDYNGFSANQTWTKWEKTAEVKLFEDKNIDLGSEIQINQASIKANEKSLDFYARLKLEYKFYSISGEPKPEAQNEELKKLIKTSTNFFDQNWVPSTDGWFYYGSGSTLKEFKNNLQPVNLFATDAKLIVDGESITIEGGDLKVIVSLVIDTLQGSLDPETNGWGIITMLKLNSEDCVIDNTSGIYSPNSAFLANNPQSSFTFLLNEKTAVITGYVGSPETIVIPTKIVVDGQVYTTTSIGIMSFSSCSSLTSITLPNSVNSIGSNAFWSCSSLTSITIPDSVTYIGENVFGNCSSLTSVTIGNRVTYIGESVFGNCSSLTSVTIGNSVNKIEDSAFNGCRGLTSIHIGAGIHELSWLLYGVSLTTITISKDNPYLATDSKAIFAKVNGGLIVEQYFSADTTYDIPSVVDGLSVVSIGNRAFEDRSELKSITIPDSVTFIGMSAFQYCSNLETKISDIGGNWVQFPGGSDVPPNTLLNNIDYHIERKPQ